MPGDRRSPDLERRSDSPRSESGTDRHRRRRREDRPHQQASQLPAHTPQITSISALGLPTLPPPPYQSSDQPPGYPLDLAQGPPLKPIQGHPSNPSPGHQPYQPQAQQQGYASGPFGTNVERERQGTKEQAIPVSVSADLRPELVPTSSAPQDQKRWDPESDQDNRWTEEEVVALMEYKAQNPYVKWTNVAKALGNRHDAGAYQRKFDRVKREDRKKEDNAKARERMKAKKEKEQDDLEKAPRKRQQKP